MRGVLRCVCVLLALALLAGAAVSCTAAAPTVAPTTAPAADPTSAPDPTTAPAPTSAPDPTTAPAPTSAAPEPAEPTDNVPRITIDELKALIDSGARVAILDVRPKESYQLGHVKGATSFPWKAQLTIGDVETLPPGNPIVTYCDCGPGEHDSVSVAQQLIELGAEGEVKVLSHPSIEGWIEAGYPTE